MKERENLTNVVATQGEKGEKSDNGKILGNNDNNWEIMDHTRVKEIENADKEKVDNTSVSVSNNREATRVLLSTLGDKNLCQLLVMRLTPRETKLQIKEIKSQ